MRIHFSKKVLKQAEEKGLKITSGGIFVDLDKALNQDGKRLTEEEKEKIRLYYAPKF